jgi:hypothetical protein
MAAGRSTRTRRVRGAKAKRKKMWLATAEALVE